MPNILLVGITYHWGLWQESIPGSTLLYSHRIYYIHCHNPVLSYTSAWHTALQHKNITSVTHLRPDDTNLKLISVLYILASTKILWLLWSCIDSIWVALYVKSNNRLALFVSENVLEFHTILEHFLIRTYLSEVFLTQYIMMWGIFGNIRFETRTFRKCSRGRGMAKTFAKE